MTVSTVTILSPPDGFDTYDLRPRIDMAWTGGVGPFDVRYEWDDNTGFTSPITVLNSSVTSPDSAVPTSDMGPSGTDWFFRVTVIDNDDAGELQEPVGSYRTLNFQDVNDDSRYLYVNHSIGVGFGLDSFDDLPLGDGLTTDFSRYLYVNHNIDSTQPCPWLNSISPTLQVQGGTVTLFGNSFGALQSTYDAEIRLYETQDLLGGSYVLMSPTSWSDDEITVTVPSGAPTGWVAVVHTNVGATCDGSAFKLLNVELVAANPDMGWWIQTVDKQNAVTADSTILPYNVANASFKKIMNSIGSGMIEIPLSDPDIDLIIDPIMRKGVLLRCYLDNRFRYAFYSEKLSHGLDEEGVEVARIVGRGMEVVSLWSKILPHDAPASPSKNPTWVYGSNENFVLNPGFDDADENPILTNAGGEDGNDDDGNAKGWNVRGGDLDSITAINDSLFARTDDWYIEVAASDNHSGMEQSITVIPNRVYHVRAYVKDETAAGMRVTLALGGADDISATSTYPNNFEWGNEILAELDNVARHPDENGLPGGSTDGTWQVMNVEVLTGSEQTSLTIAVQNDHHKTGIFVDFGVDDITIEGWGLGLEPWTTHLASKHASDSFRLATSPTFDSSPFSLALNPASQWAGIDQLMSVNPLTKYTQTLWVHTTSPAVDDYYKLELVESDGDGVLATSGEIVPDDGVWTQYQVIYTTDSDTDELIFRFVYSGTNDPPIIYLDSASVVPGEPAATGGVIANAVLDAMNAAGKLIFLIRTWTDTEDSNGVPWPSNLSLDIEPQESLYGLLNRFVALGHEWEIVPVNFIEGGDTGFELNLYTARAFNPDSGIDISHINDTGGPVITPGDATFAGRIVKTAFNVNTVFAIGDDGVWSQVQQFPYETGDIPSSDPAPLGYKESFGIIEDVILVSANDTETISQYGEARLTDEKARERTIQVNMQRASDIRPFLHFGVGASMFIDMPPHNPDVPDSTTGLRSYPKRIRAIQASLSGEGADVTFVIDIDRVIYEDELAWLALIAQLAERSPTENTGQGTGKISSAGGTVVSTSTVVEAGPHTHNLTSTNIRKKAASGDISGTLPGPVTVNRIKGSLVSVTVPSITRTLDPHRVVWLFDRDLLQWVPTELTDRDEEFFNGTFLEHMRTIISESGGTVTMALDATGGGDLTMRFSDGHTVLDTTPALTIDLTVGTDSVPQMNYIYILQSDKILTKSTSGYPTTVEHIRIATFYVRSAAKVAADGGTTIHQAWNNEAAHPSGQGHYAKHAERTRRNRARWFSGFDGVGTSDYLTLAGTTVDFKASSGIVYQLHDHLVDAHDTSVGDPILVKNWFADPFHEITNLFDIVDDSTGTTIGNNKWFKFVAWAVASGGDFHPYIINLPSGFYNTQEAAEADLNSYADFDIPREFAIDSTTGFLIAAIIVQKQATSWVFGSTEDLRGLSPAIAATGGATAGISQFSDSIFHIFNNADNTKVVELDVSNVATDTTRTWTVPDLDGTVTIEGVIPVKTDTGDPGSPVEGQLYVNTFDNKIRVYADGAWRDLATW